MSELKKPSDWATAKDVEPAFVAGLLIMTRWDREPAKQVTEAEFDEALGRFLGIEIGGAHIPMGKADEKGEVG